MQMLHTVLKRGGLVWDREQVPAALFPPRLARVQEAIAAAGHAAWLVYGDALRHGDLSYLTHYLPRAQNALLVVPRPGAPVLLVPGGLRGLPAARELTWIEDVRPLSRLPRDLASLAAEQGWEQGTVGLVSVDDLLAAGEWDQIAAALPEVRWQSLGLAGADDTIVARLRAAKGPAELALLRRAAAIVADGLAAAAATLRPGLTERELLASVDHRMRYGAAEDVRLLIASGPRASVSLRPADDRVLQAGDVVLLHLAAQYQRYWAEGGQTFVLGAADAELRRLARTAATAVEAMVGPLRGGAQAGSAAEAALTVLHRAPSAAAAPPATPDGSAGNSSLSYGLGHGIGLDLEEPPYLRPGEAAALADGAVLALHVVLHGSGGHGALATRSAVVGRDGALPLASEGDTLLELRA